MVGFFTALLILLAACSGDGDESASAPAESAPRGDDLTGESQLHGIWLLDGDAVLLRLSTADQSYAIDDSGLLGVDPDDTGTYTFDGRTLTFTSGEETRECQPGDRAIWNVGILPTLQLVAVVIEDECGRSVGEEKTWTSAGLLRNPEQLPEAESAAGSGQAANESELIGIWKQEDGAHLIRFGEDGSYVIDENLDLDTFPDESGTFSLEGNTLTFERGTESVICVGDRWIWELDYAEDGRLKGTPVDYVEDGPPNIGCQIEADIGNDYRLFRISP